MRNIIISSAKHYARYSLLFIIPVILVIYVHPVRRVMTPYWYFLTSVEGEYSYLLSSLNLAGLHKVNYIDHPGTPLQVVAAITLRLSNLIQGNASLTEEVLKNPELYLKIINHVLLALALVTLLLVGFLTAYVTGNLLHGLIVQSVVFLSYVIPLYLAKVGIETFLIIPCLLYIASIILMFKYDIDDFPKLYIVLFSIIFGMGAAAKLTFIPLILFPLFVMPGIRYKIYVLLGSMAGFVFFTIPIITQYPQLFHWIYTLSLHRGTYGRGEFGIVDLAVFNLNMKNIFLNNPKFSILFLLSFLFYGLTLIFTRIKPYLQAFKGDRILLGLIVVEGCQIIMVSKHYLDNHYLLPAIMLSIVNLLIIFLCVGEYLKENKLYQPVSNIIFSCLQLSVVVLLIFLGMKDITNITQGYDQRKKEVIALHQKVEGEFGDYAKVYYYDSPSLEYALKIGNEFAGQPFSQRLSEIYDNKIYFWNIWTRKYSNWVEDMTIEDIRAKAGDKIIFVGISFERYMKYLNGYKPDSHLKDIFNGDIYRIYLVEH